MNLFLSEDSDALAAITKSASTIIESKNCCLEYFSFINTNLSRSSVNKGTSLWKASMRLCVNTYYSLTIAANLNMLTKLIFFSFSF